MLLDANQTKALNGLCSGDRLDLMDTIDSLRSQGISHFVSLPQIIVCGDQSSGKSSVLEAISGVPFPVKSSLCTRFPTELVLRRNAEVSVKISIVPHHSRRDAEKESLAAFHETLQDLTGFAALIDRAQAAMGISTHGKAFSQDLLRVEIAGPDRPHLTIVDLPGLVHAQTKYQSAADVDLIREVVQSYMREPRSIILAVVSAKNDIANQVVLQLVRAADPGGLRTLGVITKPDLLHRGSTSENVFVSLARNQEVEFRLGWHVLRNLDTEAGTGTGHHTLVLRDAQEQRFFFGGEGGDDGGGIWAAELPHSALGIEPLRRRLSQVLLGHIVAELPSLVSEIEAKHAACGEALGQLGRPRVTLDEQKTYLLGVSQTFQELVRSAIDANYQNASFFQDAQTEHGYQCRLRAVVQNLNEAFAQDLAKRGHYRQIREEGAADNDDGHHPVSISRHRFLGDVQAKMRRSKGRELAGLFDPMIVSDLFCEQAQPWAGLAKRHVHEVWAACQTFLHHVLAHVTDPGTAQALFQKIFKPAMARLLAALEAKTDAIIHAYRGVHPITYDSRVAQAVNTIQAERRRVQHAKIIKEALGYSSGTECVNVNFTQLIANLADATINPDPRRAAASEAIDYMTAYYDVALRRFIDDVAVEAVEVCLLSELGKVLSPLGVYQMVPDLVTAIAGESDDIQARRKQLGRKLAVLAQGAETCRSFIVGMDLVAASDGLTTPADKDGDIRTYDVVSTKSSSDSSNLVKPDDAPVRVGKGFEVLKKEAVPEPYLEAEPEAEPEALPDEPDMWGTLAVSSVKKKEKKAAYK